MSEILIEARADVNFVFKDRSALMLAVEKGNNRIVSLLLQAGADVNRQNKDGDTALLHVAEQGNACLLNMLIKAGADVNGIFQDGETALMLALIRGQSQCVAALINAGADVNAKSRRGETALCYAISGRNDDCIKLMIKAGADLHGSRLLYNLVANENPGSFVEYGTDFKIKALLRTGAKVNYIKGNFLTSCLNSRRRDLRKKELALLLFAAGEELNKKKSIVPDYLEPPKRRTLKHLCRKAIREHLLKMSDVNLFYTVARLGLPPALSKYLLYEQSVAE